MRAIGDVTMRDLSEPEYDDLNMVLRSLCKETGRSYNWFADQAAKRTEARLEAAGSTFRDLREKADQDPITPFNIIEKFLHKPGNKFVGHVLIDMLAMAEELVEHHHQQKRREEFQLLLDSFQATPQYRTIDGVMTALKECRNWEQSGRRKKREEAELKTIGNDLKSNISQVFLRLARDFGKTNRDIDTEDTGIGNSRYVCIRASSQKSDAFIVHGLRFAPHLENDRFFHFSERFPRTPTEIRKTVGLCFFDSGYITGVARPQDVGSITYLVGDLNESNPRDADGNILSFWGMISTANSENVRIGAKVFFLRCTSKEQRDELVGIYEKDELLNRLPTDYRDEIEQNLRKLRRRVIAI